MDKIRELIAEARRQIHHVNDEETDWNARGWSAFLDALTRELSAFMAETQQQQKCEQVAWLVALGSSTPQWWTGRGDEWTTDVDGTLHHAAKCAMRFARKEDAERAIGWLVKEGTRDGCKAEEHIWL
jgi:hypothetical protein